MLKRLLSSFLLAILSLTLMSGVAYAFLYRAPVAITENASTSYGMLPVLWDQNNTWLANNGFMSSTANDTRVQTLGGLNKPWLVADNKTLTAVPVPANSQTNLYFTTGETAASAMDIILGYGGYVTVADHMDIELSDNFTVTFPGWVDTDSGTDKYLLQKPLALSIYVSPMVSGNITVSLVSGNATMNLLPTAAGDYTTLTPTGAASNWDCVNDPVATPDDDTTYVYPGSSPVIYQDSYNIQDPASQPGSVISVNVSFRGMRSGTVDNYVLPYLRLNGVSVNGTAQDVSAGVYTTYSQTIARPGGGLWSWDDIDDLQVGAWLERNGAGDYARLTQTYASVVYSTSTNVSAIGVTSGDHNIVVSADSANLSISVGGVLQDTVALAGASVLDNTNDYTFLSGNVMPYADSIVVTKGGNEVLRYQPNDIISGTVLPDRAGTAQNGVITWGSNPAGVGVTLGSMTSSGQASIGDGIDTGTSDLLPPVGGTDWRPAPGVSTTLQANPLRPIVVAISDNTTLSEYQVWVWFGIIAVAFVTVLVGANVRGHHLITGIAASAMIVLLVVWTVFPLLSLVIVVLAIWGGLISERSPSL